MNKENRRLGESFSRAVFFGLNSSGIKRAGAANSVGDAGDVVAETSRCLSRWGLWAVTGGKLGSWTCQLEGNSAGQSSPQGSVAEASQSERFDPFKHLKTMPAEELWPRYFEQDLSSNEVRRTVQRLHRSKQHDHVISALHVAILAGQPEPWMYEVLALTMEIQKYPKKEVERVLLSMTDFNARDVPNLLGSAAYLLRLGAGEQALKLYRQASLLEPSRPEPYLFGLRLAEKQKDADGILWAATGILTYYWLDGYQKQHEVALRAAHDLQLRLESAGEAEEAQRIAETLKRAVQRDLQIKLVWSGDADLDLIVEEPLGTTCSFSERYTASGGALVHDGAGPRQQDCYEEYICAYAATGNYVVTVSHSAGRVVGNRARMEVVRYAGTAQEEKEVHHVVLDEREKKFQVILQHGRRTEKTPVFESPKLGTKKK